MTRTKCPCCGRNINVSKEQCPYCKGHWISKAGFGTQGTQKGKQRFLCNNCHRAFVPGDIIDDIIVPPNIEHEQQM
jgi:RNA polymerase subunit RPABC4/transcription elongation factor Spt4